MPTDVDPQLLGAVVEVVRLVTAQQEQNETEQQADAETEKAKSERPVSRRLYDLQSAADQLSLSRSKLWTLIRAGRLRTVKVDGRTLVAATELDRFAIEEVRSG